MGEITTGDVTWAGPDLNFSQLFLSLVYWHMTGLPLSNPTPIYSTTVLASWADIVAF